MGGHTAEEGKLSYDNICWFLFDMYWNIYTNYDFTAWT